MRLPDSYRLVAQEVLEQNHDRLTRAEKAFQDETLLSNALAKALRERGFDHVWDPDTRILTISQEISPVLETISSGHDSSDLSASEAAHEGLIDDAPCAYVYHGDLLGPCGFPRAWHHSKSHAYVAPEPAATSDHDDAPCVCGLPQNHQFHEGHKWGHDYQPIVKPALCASCNHKEHGDGTPCREMIKVKVRDGGVAQGCPSHIEERMCFCYPKVYREVHGLPEPAPAPAEAYVAALREELRQKTESHRLAATEAEKLRADLASARAELAEEQGRLRTYDVQRRHNMERARTAEALLRELRLQLDESQQTSVEYCDRLAIAEAQLRSLEAKIQAVRALSPVSVGTHSCIPVREIEAVLGKEQPNG